MPVSCMVTGELLCSRVPVQMCTEGAARWGCPSRWLSRIPRKSVLGGKDCRRRKPTWGPVSGWRQGVCHLRPPLGGSVME